jgi:mRNA-degrading endonuclease RelE of RelBE toxin-antitoxin system
VKVRLSRRAARDFEALPRPLQRQSNKQFDLLAQNRRHPSLQAKKYPEAGEGVWQGRVNRDYRFYFVIEEDVYVVLRVVPHPK